MVWSHWRMRRKGVCVLTSVYQKKKIVQIFFNSIRLSYTPFTLSIMTYEIDSLINFPGTSLLHEQHCYFAIVLCTYILVCRCKWLFFSFWLS